MFVYNFTRTLVFGLIILEVLLILMNPSVNIYDRSMELMSFQQSPLCLIYLSILMGGMSCISLLRLFKKCFT